MASEYWTRKATDEDLPEASRMWLALTAFEASLSPRFQVKPQAERFWREELERDRLAGRAELFIAETSHGKPVGLLHIRAVPGAPFHHEDRLGFVDAVWVEPEHRRHGLAKRLIAAGTEWCRERKLTLLEAGVVVANEDAVKAWTHLGFEMTAATMTFRIPAHGPLDKLLTPGRVRTASDSPFRRRVKRFMEVSRPEAGSRVLLWHAGQGAPLAEVLRGRVREVVEHVPSSQQVADPQLPFADAAFPEVIVSDVPIASKTGEHALSEAARVLAPGGALTLDTLVTTDDPARASQHKAFERLRSANHPGFPTPLEARTLLERVGLEIQEQVGVQEPRELEAWMMEVGVDETLAERIREAAERAAELAEQDPMGLLLRRVGEEFRFDYRRLMIRAVKPPA